MKDAQQLRAKTDLATPDTSWHTVPSVPPDLVQLRDQANAVLITFRQVDGDGAALELPRETVSADVTLILVAVLEAREVNLVAGSETLTAHDLSVPLTASVPTGWSIGMHLSAITGADGDAVELQVWAQPYRA